MDGFDDIDQFTCEEGTEIKICTGISLQVSWSLCGFNQSKVYLKTIYGLDFNIQGLHRSYLEKKILHSFFEVFLPKADFVLIRGFFFNVSRETSDLWPQLYSHAASSTED